MKVLYEYQSFFVQTRGGISNSFVELISHLPFRPTYFNYFLFGLCLKEGSLLSFYIIGKICKTTCRYLCKHSSVNHCFV